MNNPKVRIYLLMLVIGTGILMYLPLIRSLQAGSFLLSAAYFVLLPIGGLVLTAALYVLLYALIAALCGGKVQLIGLYPFQLSRKENGGWRVQVLPAAEAGLGVTLAAVPWEEETSGLQQRAQLILHYAGLALAVLFGVLTAQLHGTVLSVLCFVMSWLGFLFVLIFPPSEIRRNFLPEKRHALWQRQCVLVQSKQDTLLTEMPEEYFAPLDEIQNVTDTIVMLNRSSWLVMQNRYQEALDILTMLAQEHREQTKRLWWQLIPCGVLCELALGKPGYFLKEYDTLYVQKDLRKHKKQPLVWRTAYAVHLLRDGDEQKAEQCRQQFLRLTRHTSMPHSYQWTIDRMVQEKGIYESRKAKESQS